MQDANDHVTNGRTGPNAKHYFTALYEYCIEPFKMFSFIGLMLAGVLSIPSIFITPPPFIVVFIVGGYICGLPAAIVLTVHMLKALHSRAVQISER